MYLKECLIENVGPIDFLDISLPFNGDSTPKPLILVGKNGSGKSILVSYIVDALIEFAKVAYEDIVLNQQAFSTPYFKLNGPINQRIGSKFNIGLLEFFEKDKVYSYLDKSGTLGIDEYQEKMKGRFADVRGWPVEENNKKCSQDSESFRKIFLSNSICYFPSNRVERPHWLNIESIAKNLSFNLDRKIMGKLGKPIFIESSVEENKKWILDVFLDSKVDFEPDGDQFIILGNIPTKIQLKQSRKNIETILKQILQESSIILSLNYRNNYQYRLCVAKGNQILIPSLDHLSSGQSILFNVFVTIIRYADKGDINKSIKLHEIEGIAVIDEVDAHLDTELQYSILPQLLKLFPRIQFILTTHSPLFLLGMEKQYGKDGFEIVEMPTGMPISLERFSEFKRSFEFFKDTKAFEEELQTKVQRLLLSSTRPMVLLEGKTDLMYINKALALLGRNDVLEQVDMDQVGIDLKKGSENSGSSALEMIENIYSKNKHLLKHKLLLLYDCDMNKKQRNDGYLFVESITKIEKDCAFPRGIENLLPEHLLRSDYFLQNRGRFYRTSKKEYCFKSAIVEEFDKDEFCKWICKERENADDFKNFNIIIDIFEKFLSSNVSL